jgi:FkbH-like protein
MTQHTFNILLVADSTIDPLGRFLSQSRPDVRVKVAPYGQAFNTLSGDLSGNDLVVVFTQPDKVSPEYQKAQRYEPFDRVRALAELSEFAALLGKAAAGVPCLAALTWVRPFWALPAGVQGWHGPCGTNRMLAEGNLRLAEVADRTNNLFLLDQAEALNKAGAAAFDPKLWAMGKVVYSRPVLETFSREIHSLVDAIQGRSRKLIVLDLDNTLWGGVVGDDGWQNLKLGGIDPIGECYGVFQQQLKALRSKGVLLAIVSKNEESVALEAIRRHPEMVLRLEDFAGWRINWQDKAGNLADLVKELNLGLQSVVFIDDNAAERDRVRQASPEVLVPDWPADPALYPTALKNLACFETLRLSEEDRQRTKLYQQERHRTQSLGTAASPQEWLRSLEMKVRIQRLQDGNLPRAAQLLNKTNQFNLSTRRLTEKALADWAGQDGHTVLTFDVQDRFGGYGLVGLLGLCVEPGTGALRILDWVTSCRALGRGLEEVMLTAAAKVAVTAGCNSLVATYLPTAKNKPIHGFLAGITGASRRENTFVICPAQCHTPEHVSVSDEAVEGGTATCR